MSLRVIKFVVKYKVIVVDISLLYLHCSFVIFFEWSLASNEAVPG